MIRLHVNIQLSISRNNFSWKANQESFSYNLFLLKHKLQIQYIKQVLQMKKRSVEKQQNRSMTQSRQSVFDSEYLEGQRNLTKLESTIRSEWKIDHPHTNNSSQVFSPSSASVEFSYKRKFDEQYGNINSQFMDQRQLEDSLSQMRSLLKLMNDFINSKVSNTYKYLAKAAVEQQPVNQQKQYEVLKARYQNNEQRLQIQKNDIQHLTQLTYSLGDPQTMLDDIQGQIVNTNDDLKKKEKTNKEAAIDVEKNDVVLSEQGVDKQFSQFYIFFKKLKVLWQYQTNKSFKMDQHQKKLDGNIQDLKYKLDEITDKLAQYKKIAQQKSLEVSTNPGFIHTKEKFIELQKTKANYKRKNQLTAKNLDHNLLVLNKSLNESKKNLENYDKKIQEIQRQIQVSIEVITKLSSHQKFIDNSLLKNISQRYSIQHYLQKAVEKPKEVFSNSRPNSIISNEKVSLRSRVIKKQAKSQHKQQFSNSMVLDNSNNIELALEEQILGTPHKNKPLFRLGKPTPKISQNISFNSQIGKQRQLTYAQSQQQISKKKPPTPQKIINSKPSLRVNRRDPLDTPLNKTEDLIAKVDHTVEQIPNLKPSRFGRLNQRKKGDNQISQQYMKTLEQRGRKILGL